MYVRNENPVRPIEQGMQLIQRGRHSPSRRRLWMPVNTSNLAVNRGKRVSDELELVPQEGSCLQLGGAVVKWELAVQCLWQFPGHVATGRLDKPRRAVRLRVAVRVVLLSCPYTFQQILRVVRYDTVTTKDRSPQSGLGTLNESHDKASTGLNDQHAFH
jgi:hypothetical protein